jgi:ATP-binding cassette subfamily B protein RaxB
VNAAALPEILRRGRVARTPLVMQAEQHECALACLAMVAGYHGRGPDLPALRALGGDGGRGAGLRDLMQLAEGMGLHARPLRLEPGELRQLRTPAILHWDLDHFVVLDGAGWRGVTILDPARGRRRLSLAEAGEHLTGVALELIPGPGFERGAEGVDLVEREGFGVRIQNDRGRLRLTRGRKTKIKIRRKSGPHSHSMVAGGLLEMS